MKNLFHANILSLRKAKWNIFSKKIDYNYIHRYENCLRKIHKLYIHKNEKVKLAIFKNTNWKKT